MIRGKSIIENTKTNNVIRNQNFTNKVIEKYIMIREQILDAITLYNFGK